jgi:hypothetical protein
MKDLSSQYDEITARVYAALKMKPGLQRDEYVAQTFKLRRQLRIDRGRRGVVSLEPARLSAK